MTTNYSDRTDRTDRTDRDSTAYAGKVPQQRRLTTETKSAFMTTELMTYVVAVIGVLIASAVIGSNDDGTDFFRADRAWLFITMLTIGYMVSRGLAKSGSRERYDADAR